jgi:hypothetical protein
MCNEEKCFLKIDDFKCINDFISVIIFKAVFFLHIGSAYFEFNNSLKIFFPRLVFLATHFDSLVIVFWIYCFGL